MFRCNDSSDFGQYLKKIRKKLKLTQHYINELTGLNPDTIRKLESGLVIPKYDTLAILSQVYKVDLVRKFSEHQKENTLVSLYADVDHYILNNDINGLISIKTKLENPKFYQTIDNQLLLKVELEQFQTYIEVLLTHLTDENVSFDNSLLALEKALCLTIPKFSTKSFVKFAYNFFELRLLILYAIMWARFDNFKLSNQIMIFILDWLDYLFADETIAAKFKIKAHFNISYNYHCLDQFENSLEHAEKGIALGREYEIFSDLHSLYYRKFTSELNLNRSNYMNSLKKCICIMELLGNYSLLNSYVEITKKIYNIDISDWVQPSYEGS